MTLAVDGINRVRGCEESALNRVSCQKRIWVFVLLGIIPLGCGGASGPPLGKVSGTITLDGQPLAGASVSFSPMDGGRSSTGVTDSSGHYSLEYSLDKSGALVGEHEVRIHSAEFTGEAAKDPVVPERYNSKSELKGTVDKSGSTLDFELTSGGAR